MSEAPGTPARGSLAVRFAHETDLPRVRELMRGLAEYERMLDFFTGDVTQLRDALFGGGPRVECLVAESAGSIVGYALFYPVFGSFRARWRFWLEDLFVDPAHRGTGAGRRLLAALAKLARQRGMMSVDWSVLEWNEPAIDFYRRQGAERIVEDWHTMRLAGDALIAMSGEPPRPDPS